MNTKWHATRDRKGRQLFLFVTAGQVSDKICAGVPPGGLPKIDWLLRDRDNAANWFQAALKDKGICAYAPGRTQCKIPVKYDKYRYKRHNRIRIMFEHLKGWGRVATRYD